MSDEKRTDCIFPERSTCGICTLCKNRKLIELVWRCIHEVEGRESGHVLGSAAQLEAGKCARQMRSFVEHELGKDSEPPRRFSSPAVTAEGKKLGEEGQRMLDGVMKVIAEGTSRGDKTRGVYACCFACRRSTAPGSLMARELEHWPNCPIAKLIALLPPDAADTSGEPHAAQEAVKETAALKEGASRPVSQQPGTAPACCPWCKAALPAPALPKEEVAPDMLTCPSCGGALVNCGTLRPHPLARLSPEELARIPAISKAALDAALEQGLKDRAALEASTPRLPGHIAAAPILPLEEQQGSATAPAGTGSARDQTLEWVANWFRTQDWSGEPMGNGEVSDLVLSMKAMKWIPK